MTKGNFPNAMHILFTVCGYRVTDLLTHISYSSDGDWINRDPAAMAHYPDIDPGKLRQLIEEEYDIDAWENLCRGHREPVDLSLEPLVFFLLHELPKCYYDVDKRPNTGKPVTGEKASELAMLA